MLTETEVVVVVPLVTVVVVVEIDALSHITVVKVPPRGATSTTVGSPGTLASPNVAPSPPDPGSVLGLDSPPPAHPDTTSRSTASIFVILIASFPPGLRSATDRRCGARDC